MQRTPRLRLCSLAGVSGAGSLILVVSPSFLKYVYDFQLDGFMLLRRGDITGLKA